MVEPQVNSKFNANTGDDTTKHDLWHHLKRKCTVTSFFFFNCEKWAQYFWPVYVKENTDHKSGTKARYCVHLRQLKEP